MFKKGFTLIEMLITAAIFCVVISVATGIFVSSIRVQQRSLAFQEVLSEVSYATEYMSKALRMAQKDLLALCITENYNYELTRGGKGIAFMTYNGECQEFYWDDTAKKLVQLKGTPVDMTSGNVEITAFNINLRGHPQGDGLQPQATFFLRARGKVATVESQYPELELQTTVSQRNLDVTRQ